MTRFIVRAADRDDVPRMSAVAGRAFTEAYGDTAAASDIRSHVADYFSESAMRRDMARSSVRYLLACNDDACAGLVKLCESPPPELVPHPSAVEIQQLYVAGDFQRRGVGRHLVDAAVAVARDGRKAGLWLSAWTEADWATQFYLGYGFRPLGEIPFLLGETEYTDFLMWLPVRGS